VDEWQHNIHPTTVSLCLQGGSQMLMAMSMTTSGRTNDSTAPAPPLRATARRVDRGCYWPGHHMMVQQGNTTAQRRGYSMGEGRTGRAERENQWQHNVTPHPPSLAFRGQGMIPPTPAMRSGRQWGGGTTPGGRGRGRGRGGGETTTAPAPRLRASTHRVVHGCVLATTIGDGAREVNRGTRAQHPTPTTVSTCLQGGLGANGHVTTGRRLPHAYSLSHSPVKLWFVVT
jgi:hypothetical protein